MTVAWCSEMRLGLSLILSQGWSAKTTLFMLLGPPSLLWRVSLFSLAMEERTFVVCEAPPGRSPDFRLPDFYSHNMLDSSLDFFFFCSILMSSCSR